MPVLLHPNHPSCTLSKRINLRGVRLINPISNTSKGKATRILPGFWTSPLYRGALLLLWTVLMAVSLGWNLNQHLKTIQDQARVIARTAFEKDVLYRRWNSSNGGVYVWITPNSQPNPYLKEFPERDLKIDQNRSLTLINPAYMTRQVFELQQSQMGVIGHITSLNPVRPLNKADEWESVALKSFEQGANEASTLTETAGIQYLRLMRPLIVEEKCLQCHASQGYQLGQVRGGISESVPLTPLISAGQGAKNSLIIAHALIWLFGSIGLVISTSALKSSLIQQSETEQKLLELSIHDPLSGLFNRSYFEDSFNRLSRMKSQPISVLMADIDLLKQTNDTLGHAAGDDLIRRTARVLHSCFRTDDILARIGGDEFVAIIPNSSEEQAIQVLQRVQDALKNHNLENPDLPLQISLGIATSEPGQPLDLTLKAADANMYAAKRANRQGYLNE